MSKIKLSKPRFRRLVESIIEDIWSTPDTIQSTDVCGGKLHFKNNNAIPFFVLNNHTIIYGEKASRHLDYISKMNTNQRQSFVSNIRLQGRYWLNDNMFSFWYIDEDDTTLITDTVVKICNEYKRNPKTAKVFYRDKIITLTYDDRDERYWQQETYNDIEDYLPEVSRNYENPDEVIEYWFDSTGDFIRSRCVMLITDRNHQPRCKMLNKYEWLCTTAYRIYCDLLKQDSYDKFSYQDFDAYLRKHYKTSFHQLMNDFHSRYRNYIMTYDEYKQLVKEDYEASPLEDIVMDYGLDTSEYKIVRYDGSNDIYAILVRTTDKIKATDIIQDADERGLLVDRCNERQLGDDISLYTLRVRQKQ